MQGQIIQGLDLIDIIKFIYHKNKVFQRVLLDDVESVLGKDSEEYKQIRKLILDSYNNYTRSIVRAIFGSDFEGIIK